MQRAIPPVMQCLSGRNPPGIPRSNGDTRMEILGLAYDDSIDTCLSNVQISWLAGRELRTTSGVTKPTPSLHPVLFHLRGVLQPLAAVSSQSCPDQSTAPGGGRQTKIPKLDCQYCSHSGQTWDWIKPADGAFKTL